MSHDRNEMDLLDSADRLFILQTIKRRIENKIDSHDWMKFLKLLNQCGESDRLKNIEDRWKSEIKKQELLK